jgi:hydrogenase maturation protease
MVIEHRAEASSLLRHLAAAQRAFLVDASVSGVRPGTIQRFDVGAAPLPAVPRKLSAHGLDLGEAIELARVLGQLPCECVVYLIEAGQCEGGGALTPAVKEAAATVAGRLLSEIGRLREAPVPAQ